MEKAISADGTPIAYSRTGSGPAIVLVDGAFGHRSFGPNESLVPLLAPHFTVYTYDRRGRGDSGDTQPYAVQREIEDVRAVIEAAGGSAFLYGISSGAVLAIEAAAAGLPVTRLAVFEPPFVVDDNRAPLSADYAEQVAALTAADDRGALVKLFMTKAAGVPAFGVFMMRLMPVWKALKGLAHTVQYETAVLGDGQSGRPLAPGRWDVAAPTLVVGGTKSPLWMKNSVESVATVLPNARLHMLPGQNHIVKAAALAPVLIDFFADAKVDKKAA
ncbi:alpha/beta fold hydrolase [Actinophytocola gossypii]|uniref:Alpha/beta hydrolase n=1 Tax=Actinophytocola gossypii TaxID=2812003 RepID=A0ABT2JHA6_9PSEU|nr:alpha/beta hydrolase [Actinophytocola gossypii]MCT2586795.1 alpha/beta hydrolase [Actinophytocola gossypii]